MNMTSRLLVAAGLLACCFGLAHASDYKIGSLEINHAWARATPKGAKVGAGYLTITNTGTAPDRLVGGSLAAAAGFSIHEMTTVDGVSKMRPLSDGLEIKPGETVELKPGSFHLMFTDLKQPLAQGEHVKGTLVFAKAGTIDVEFGVQPVGGAAPSHDSMPGMHGDHMH
jgi:periplasmic copper chaperone A